MAVDEKRPSSLSDVSATMLITLYARALETETPNPTALELTREEWQPYIDAARKRPLPAKSNPIKEAERARLMARVREAADQLKQRFHVRKVVLFGSLADADWFVSDSDVDLAVEGLKVEDFWQAWRLVEDIISNRPVDLIEIETASDSLRQAIDHYGIEL